MPTDLDNQEHYTIGLIGGIASGKSFVARYLAKKGAEIIDADRLGHIVLEMPQVIDELTNRFGTQILNDSGTIDRSELGKLVFGDDDESVQRLKTLEDVVHPLIRLEATNQLDAIHRSNGQSTMVVLDAPLLVEANWHPLCNIILFVDTPLQTRLDRARLRGWSEEQFQRREASQLPIEEKRKYASHIVSGDDEANMQAQVDAILAKLSEG